MPPLAAVPGSADTASRRSVRVVPRPRGRSRIHEDTAEHEPLPEDWPYTRKWLIGTCDAGGELVAFANVVSDLLAPRV